MIIYERARVAEPIASCLIANNYIDYFQGLSLKQKDDISRCRQGYRRKTVLLCTAKNA